METETGTTHKINQFPPAINLPGIQLVKRLWLLGDRAYSWRIQTNFGRLIRDVA